MTPPTPAAAVPETVDQLRPRPCPTRLAALPGTATASAANRSAAATTPRTSTQRGSAPAGRHRQGGKEGDRNRDHEAHHHDAHRASQDPAHDPLADKGGRGEDDAGEEHGGRQEGEIKLDHNNGHVQADEDKGRINDHLRNPEAKQRAGIGDGRPRAPRMVENEILQRLRDRLVLAEDKRGVAQLIRSHRLPRRL